MNIFDHWRAQECRSTMTRLMDENIALRRWKKINQVVALVAWCAALGMAVYFSIGGKLI